MIKKILIFALLILSITEINTMYFFVNSGKTECLTQKKFQDEEFRIIYYLSGAQETGNLVKFILLQIKNYGKELKKKMINYLLKLMKKDIINFVLIIEVIVN